MRYKVPQNVQREDTILWFITLRQLIIVLIGAGISYFIFVQLNKSYELNTIEMIMCWIPAIIALGVAFIKIKRIDLFKFILLLIENTVFRPKRRFWDRHGNPFVSFTTKIENKNKKAIAPDKKAVSEDRIKNLAAVLDGEKTKINTLKTKPL